MNNHAEIQVLLYDYLSGEVTPEERRKIEGHIAGCLICGRELEELKSFNELSFAKKRTPSDELPEEYWREFASNIEQKVSARRKKPVYSIQKWWDPLITFVRFRPRFTAIFASSMAIIAVTVSLIMLMHKESPKLSMDNLQSVVTEPVNVDERVGQYLKKSKVLLVGLSNMDTMESTAEDLSTERTVSRQLANEARYLQQQSIDIQASRLIRDLAKVQEALADFSNTNENADLSTIRQNINNNNLLFKVRMAESVYGNARFVRAGGKRGVK
jgi:Putative zinc-finger